MRRLSPAPTLISLLVILLLAVPAPGLLLAQEKKEAPKGPPPSPVVVAAVTQKTVSTQITLIGTTEPIRESTVAAEVTGVVTQFPVTEGQFVEKGALLAAMRDKELRLRLAALQATREQYDARLKMAAIELERYEKLKTTNSIADTEYDKTFYNHKAINSQRLGAEAQIASLEYDLKQKAVQAPFAGFIVEEHTQVGQWLIPGSPVVKLVDLSRIRVMVDVPERHAVKLNADKPAGISLTSLPGQEFKGRISSVLPYGDAGSRTFPVRVELDNPQYRIKAGMEASVTFSLSDTFEALLVPKDAVVTASSGSMVYAALEGKAVPIPVEVLGYYDENVAVKGQLKPGIPVVIRGNERLRPGQPVQITE